VADAVAMAAAAVIAAAAAVAVVVVTVAAAADAAATKSPFRSYRDRHTFNFKHRGRCLSSLSAVLEVFSVNKNTRAPGRLKPVMCARQGTT